MKNKGFTLIEMLCVFAIILILATIVLPSVNTILKGSRDDLYKTQINVIKEAARLWGAKNIYNLPSDDGDSVTISLLQLKLSGFLEPNIENPKTEELFPDDMNIVITKKGQAYFYEVLEDSGTKNELIDPDAPLITLNGGVVQNVEINTPFVDLGATAESKDHTSLSVQTVIKKDGVVTDVDTSELGIYIITYSATYNDKTTSIERKVQVIDTIKPVLTCVSCPSDLIINVESSSSYILPEVRATDNSLLSGNLIVTKEGSFSSIIPGTKKVTYKAIDSSGNIGSLDVTFVVKDTVLPTIDVETTINPDTLVTTVRVNASDNGVGLHNLAYSFDGGNTWQMSSSSVFKNEGIYEILVRDKVGNIASKTIGVSIPVPIIQALEEKVSNENDIETYTNGQLINLGEYGIRYQGSNPDNYIYFNCSDYNNPTKETCELWRIIGIVDGKVKIIKSDSIGNMAWNTNGTNDWVNSSLNTYLNNEYLTSLITKNSVTQQMVSSSTWYLRGHSIASETKDKMYNLERTTGTIKYEIPYIDNIKIGIMYLSDLGYAALETESCLPSTTLNSYLPCKSTNWIMLGNSSGFEWIITPYSGNAYAFRAYSNGNTSNGGVAATGSIRPVLYLSLGTLLTDGNGTYDEPYQIVSYSTLKEAIESDTEHIVMNTKVNGQMVNKVIGDKSNKYEQKNYVWYSGQLWQVLETNDSNHSIKLVTADPLTSISYGETNNWNTSWVKQWLNEEFLSVLKRQDIIVNTTFCLDEPNITESVQELYDTRWIKKVTGSTPINTCQNSVTEKVGLMTVEDYAYALNGTTLNYQGNNFLDDDSLNWLMNPYTGDTRTESNRNKHMWVTWYNKPSYLTVGTGLNNDGTSANNYDYSITTSYGLGVRPVISIIDEVLVKSGSGTKSDPFVLSTEKELEKGTKINKAKVGEYVYLDESNNPNNFTSQTVLTGTSYPSTKDKVMYRIVKINEDGTVKLERADVLRSLPNTIAISSNMYVPYYYKIGATAAESCLYDGSGIYFDRVAGQGYTGGCSNHNYYQPTQGSGEYAYAESENVGYFLNNATNSFYNWYSNDTKKMMEETNWNLPVGAHGKNYQTSLYNNDEVGTYPSTTNDGVTTAYVGLPQWGEIYSGNDLNVNYWYINRWKAHSSLVSIVAAGGSSNASISPVSWNTLRPVIVLKSNVKIQSGAGTISNPYSLGI